MILPIIFFIKQVYYVKSALESNTHLIRQRALKNDYQAMAGMIFGEIPEFAEVLGVIKDLETMLNQQ
jgi:hypothetical protein